MTIQLSAVSKSFGPHKALNEVDLQIGEGEFFVVLGPSGCGKSTLLRSIAGLEQIDNGVIALGGEVVARNGFHMEPEQRRAGVVFQSYALWPHMSVAGNVAFPMQTAGLKKADIRTKTQEHLKTVELTEFRDRKPADLSGGQRQRVALARCLAQGAKTVLMDEPLANLDPHLRNAMEEELAAFHKASGATTLFITHDQCEAMALADKVAVMWDGQILQVAEPDVLYRRPNSKQVAGFIGRSSLIDVQIEEVDANSARVALGELRFEADCAANTKPGKATLLLRPEHLVLAHGGHGISAIVDQTIYRGGYWETFVIVEGIEDRLMMILHRKAAVGETLFLEIQRSWVLPE